MSSERLIKENNEIINNNSHNNEDITYDRNNKGTEKQPFDESVNIIHCNLSINSTTIYTYDNTNISRRLNLNYVENITQKLGEINEIQENRMDHINLQKSIIINNKNINLILYYKKNLMLNNDLITIVILCSNKLLASFIHNLLEKLSNEYINEYYNVHRKYEFKLRMKEIINLEEGQLVKLIQNYGSIEDDIVQVRELMNENIDRILERGENLEILINKTSNLNKSSNSFRRRTTSVKRRMIWSNIKFIIIFILILLIIGYILLGIECGLPFYSECLHPPKPSQPPSKA
jgi:vesicle-associated membrane protein 7